MIALLRCADERKRSFIRHSLEKLAVEVIEFLPKDDIAVAVESYRPSVLAIDIQDEKDLKIIKEVKKNRPILFVAAIPKNEELTQKALGYEIDDIFRDGDASVFGIRVRNWIEITAKRFNYTASTNICRGKNAF